MKAHNREFLYSMLALTIAALLIGSTKELSNASSALANRTITLSTPYVQNALETCCSAHSNLFISALMLFVVIAFLFLILIIILVLAAFNRLPKISQKTKEGIYGFSIFVMAVVVFMIGLLLLHVI